MQKEYSLKKVIAYRLPHNADLLEELNSFCLKNNIRNGHISVIGAAKQAKLSFYKQDERKYIDIENQNFDNNQPLEIVSASGNVSIRDDKPFVHLHVIVADKDGNCIGGHLVKGTTIFAGEAIIQQFEGEDLVRSFDKETDLWLWG